MFEFPLSNWIHSNVVFLKAPNVSSRFKTSIFINVPIHPSRLLNNMYYSSLLEKCYVKNDKRFIDYSPHIGTRGKGLRIRPLELCGTLFNDINSSFDLQNQVSWYEENVRVFPVCSDRMVEPFYLCINVKLHTSSSHTKFLLAWRVPLATCPCRTVAPISTIRIICIFHDNPMNPLNSWAILN